MDCSNCTQHKADLAAGTPNRAGGGVCGPGRLMVTVLRPFDGHPAGHTMCWPTSTLRAYQLAGQLKIA